MKSILLNLILALILVVSLPWLVWRAFRYGKNRRGWSQKLFGIIPPRADRKSNSRCIWFHAVSVGEVNLLATLLNRLEHTLPGWTFAISTTTETGYELARKKYSEHQVFFCPMDFSWAVRNVLNRLRPSMVVLAELEVWPNMIRTIDGQGIPIAIVNGRLSEKSYAGYKRFRWAIKRILRRIDVIAVQTKEYGDRFLGLGAELASVVVTGNTKFDGAKSNRANAQTLALTHLSRIPVEDFVFVAGSTQPDEDRIATEVWDRLRSKWALKRDRLWLVLVPRHPHHVGQIVDQLTEDGIEYLLRSELGGTGPESTARVLIVDVIGELNGWWGRADVAYVGGSMGSRGGQNMIEPAAYGVPVSFGPNTKNFKDVTQMLLSGEASQVVQNVDELAEFVERAFLDNDWADQIGKRAQAIVMKQQGAADRTVKLLMQRLDDPSPDGQSVRAA